MYPIMSCLFLYVLNMALSSSTHLNL
uniref:Uncharacterized protein n=1 Tax=Anguilla anguilla TaxID=7936 RepID=A0A0E9QAJ8_ANGAN